MKLRTQKILALSTIALGVILQIFMTVVEDEPGAVNLFLVVAGTVWYLITRYRIKTQQKAGKEKKNLY